MLLLAFSFLFIRFFASRAVQWSHREAKTMKQSKRCICLDDFEWRVAVNGLNEFRTQLIREGKEHSLVDEVLQKLIDAPTKKTKAITNEEWSAFSGE